MLYGHMKVKILISLMILLVMTSPQLAWGQEPTVKIGVLAKRDKERCIQKWGPTADYLTSRKLRMIPVVILTTSEAERDVAQAYEYHANSYLVKPVDFRKFTQLMIDLGFYRLTWNYHPWA